MWDSLFYTLSKNGQSYAPGGVPAAAPQECFAKDGGWSIIVSLKAFAGFAVDIQDHSTTLREDTTSNRLP
jgi:hypothetical protein